jgi:hypothetical protein
MRPPRPNQGASPGGGDLQPEPATAEKRHVARKAQHKKRHIVKRDRNDDRNKRRKAGSRESPPMRIRRPSRRGAAMSPAWRSTGATCWGRPHCRRPVALKCRRRADCERRGATRLWVELMSGGFPCSSGLVVGPLPYDAQWDGHPRPQRPTPCQADPPRRSEG